MSNPTFTRQRLLLEDILALNRYFLPSKIFSAKEYDKFRTQDETLPTLETLRCNELVKIVDKVEYTEPLYLFKIADRAIYEEVDVDECSYTLRCTEEQAAHWGLELEDAYDVDEIKGTHFYYQLNKEKIDKILATAPLKRFAMYQILTAQIEELEKQLEELRAKRDKVS